MRLFHYDIKHVRLNGVIDLGNLSEREIALINKVIGFVAEQGLTDGRYRNLARIIESNMMKMMMNQNIH